MKVVINTKDNGFEISWTTSLGVERTEVFLDYKSLEKRLKEIL